MNQTNQILPLVSIGLPVYNGSIKKFDYSINIEKSLRSLINQDYKNLEIIVSDNCSSDCTVEIINKLIGTDKRVKFYQQKKPISPGENFEFVLNKSSGKYFKWNSHDDFISKDFISKNVEFLEKNDDFIFSSSPCRFDNELDIKNYKIFDFDCNQFNRVKNFFRIRSESHSFFYGLIKKENLMERLKNHPWKALANDWILNLELLFDGKFKTIPEGEISIGTSGISKIGDGKGYVEEKQELLTKIFPYRELFKRISKRIFNSTKLSLFNKICLIYICFKINIAYFVLYKLK